MSWLRILGLVAVIGCLAGCSDKFSLPTNTPSPGTRHSPDIVIHVDEHGQASIEGVEVNLEDVRDRIEIVLEEKEEAAVTIRGDEKCPMTSIMPLLELCRESDARLSLEAADD